MPKHYIRILPWMEDYARAQGASEPHWQMEVFNDITRSGKEIRASASASNDHGPLITLWGERFICRGGLDTRRSTNWSETDGLFISKVESRRKSTEPSTSAFPGPFGLLTTASKSPAAKGEPVLPIFTALKCVVPLSGADRRGSAQSKPSGHLTEIIHANGAEFRAGWRPGVHDERSTAGLQDDANRIWMRYRLDRYDDISPPPRRRMLLSGQARPSSIKGEDLALLRSAFNVSVLNRMAADLAGRGELSKLLKELSKLSIGDATRALIYATALAGLDGLALRRELHDAADGLAHVDAAAQDVWIEFLTDTIRDSASRLNDDSLALLADRISTSDDPLAELGNWARRLEFASTIELGHAEPSSEFVDISTTPSSHPAMESSEDEGEHHGDHPSNTAENAELVEAFDNGTLAQHTASVLSDVDNEPDVDGIRPPLPGLALVESWALRLRVGRVDAYEAAAVEIEASLWAWLETSRDLKSLTGVRGFLRSLSELHTNLLARLQSLPEAEDLALDLDDATRAFSEAVTAFGLHTAENLLLFAPDLKPVELREISKEINATVLMKLPAWLLKIEAATFDAEADTLALRLSRLADPVVREITFGASALVSGLTTDERDVVCAIAPPTHDTDLAEYFSETSQQALAAHRALAHLPVSHRPWVAIAQRDNTDLRRISNTVDRLDQLGSSLGSDATAEILRRIGGFSDFVQIEVFLTSLEDCVEACKLAFPDLTGLPLDVILRAKPRADRLNDPLRSDNSPSEFVLVEHNFVDAIGAKVSPLWVPDETENNFGHVSMPMVLRVQEPRDLEVVLRSTMRGKLRDAWPSGRGEIEPGSLSIQSPQWRQDENGFVYTFTLTVPCRRPRESRSPFEVQIQVFDTQSNSLGSKQKFEWRFGGTWDAPIAVAWPDVMQPELVRDSPIGPQHKYADMVEQLRSGGSVAVAIPRRFGKTTLVEYMHQTAADNELVIPEPVRCTEHQRDGKFDEHGFWSEVSLSLQSATGCGLRPFDISEGLPTFEAFDDARRAAAKAGRKALVILVDEAHLLFTRNRAGELGHRMKDRLEHAWARRDRDGMVPLAFCLIGLTVLLNRLGANFEATLWVYHDPRIREADLRTLISQKTQGRLHTTREVREALSLRATNLFVLKAILKRLVDHANEERRNWVAYQDLEHVQRMLVEDLKAGREPGVARFIRDVLNDADDINLWQPIPAYAVAVGMASLHGSRLRLVDRLVTWLNDLCSQFATTESYGKVVYTTEKVTSHLDTLRELKVLTDNEFTSPLVSAWLKGISGSFPAEASERKALLSGAVQRIRIPEGLEPEPVGGGSEAVVYRFTQATEQFALRKVLLATDEQRRRFLERIETLQLVRQRVDARDDGFEFIFQICAIGLSSSEGISIGDDLPGDDIGVEIYRWIEGKTLETYADQLGDLAITEISLKLAQALQLLHGHGILHRDINPSNVILADGGGRPTLIDFGFARLERLGFSTQLSGRFSAPEVCVPNPLWSTKADIYSLGFTLKAVARKDLSAEIGSLLATCTNADPASRPEARDLVRSFDFLARKLDLERQKDARWLDIQNAARPDISTTWYWSVLEKFRLPFVMIGIGLSESAVDRCREVASFLDQVLEASPLSTRNDRIKLGRVKKHNDRTGSQLATPAIDIAHLLRLDRSHSSSGTDLERKLKRVMGPQNLTLDELPNVLCDAAAQIEEVLNLSALSATVRVVVNPYKVSQRS